MRYFDIAHNNNRESLTMEQRPKTNKVQRISVSLPDSLAKELDQVVTDRSFVNRSQAIAQMVRNSLLDYHRQKGNQIMAGTVTLVYDEARPKLREKLVYIQRKHIDTVISSLNVLLENNYSLEVLQVQGPVDTLTGILKEIQACKGVESCKLALTTTIMPPIHRKRGTGNGQV